MKYIPPHVSLLLTLLCQAVGLSLGAVVQQSGGSPTYYLALHSIAAALLATYLRLSLPWLTLNALLPLAAPFFLGLELRVSWWLPLGVLFLLFAPTFWTRVPFYPSNRRMYRLVLQQLPASGAFTLLDAGCGFGTLLFFLARARPEGRFVGVELNPFPFVLARLRSLLQPRVRIYFRNFWEMPFAHYDFVYAFLAPPPMPRFWAKCESEMRSGTRVLINSFPAPVEADKVLGSPDENGQVLYVYRVG